jgi:hypothetical protein
MNDPKITITLPLSAWQDMMGQLSRLPCHDVYAYINEVGRQIYAQIDGPTFATLTAGIAPIAGEDSGQATTSVN